ncbi:MAG: Peptidase family S58 [bacterium ADurb.Bin478]|nr:hypothetical protein [bacterium]OPZ70009.1 MAG: Peptidase family S58 [bacterium ADurb.Bin478]
MRFVSLRFSTVQTNRIHSVGLTRNTVVLNNSALSPMFQAVIEAAEEAVYNSLLRAATVTGRNGHRAVALPIWRTRHI